MKTQRRLEEKFKDFIAKDDHPFFCYIHNKEGTFTYLSQNITLLLGYSPHEFEINYMSSLTPNPINKHAIFNTEKALLSGTQQDPYQLEIYDKQLNRRLLEVYESPIMNEDKVEAIEGIAKVLN